MKTKEVNWEWEKKPRRVEKGSNKDTKHRKSIYNMLSDVEDDDDYDSEGGVVMHNYNGNFNYTKQR